MVKALTNRRPKASGRVILLISTLLVTNFLFYIDEGYYDFRWMRDIGNWIVFLIYTIVMLCVQLLFFELACRIYRRRGSVAVGIIAAWTITFFLLAGFVFQTNV